MNFRKVIQPVVASFITTTSRCRFLMAFSIGLRRVLLSVTGTLVLSLLTTDAVGAQGPVSSSIAFNNGLIKLPVINKQDIRFVPLSVDGKSLQARIWSITQDNLGVVWLGTSDGLYRYDGYSLKRYQGTGDHMGLSSEPIS